jgi:hypothetical protein
MGWGKVGVDFAERRLLVIRSRGQHKNQVFESVFMKALS